MNVFEIVAPTINQNGTYVNLIHGNTLHVTFTLATIIAIRVIEFASRNSLHALCLPK